MMRIREPFPIMSMALALVLLSQLACDLNAETFTSWYGQILCESEGGVWHAETLSNEQVEEWCDKSATQEPAVIKPGEDDACFASRNTYNWSYNNFQSSSGSGGLTCNARFLFQNFRDEPVLLIVYSSWDNNAMSDSGWDTYTIPVGGEWEERVNRTNYDDGVITFNRVEKLLVVRDVPECAGIFPTDNPEAVWDSLGLLVDEMPCP